MSELASESSRTVLADVAERPAVFEVSDEEVA